MKIIVRCRNLHHSASMLNKVHAKFADALEHASDHLGAVTVHLDREGKSDAVCHVSANLIPRHHLEVSSHKPTLRDAVDHAAETLVESVERELARTIRRHPTHSLRMAVTQDQP